MRPSLPPRPPLRATAGFAIVIVVLVVGWLWLRDSSLVAVERVTVTGASGPDAPRVRSALERAGLDMTTLHVRDGALRSAVEPFAAVEGVTTSTDFPDVLRIEVHERTPVAALVAGSSRVAVAADGTLLRTTRTAGLPEIAAKTAPAGDRARGPGGRARDRGAGRRIDGAARARVQRIHVGEQGVTLPLRDGPDVYFGSSRSPAGQVGRAGRRARRPQLAGRDLHRRAAARATGGRRPRADRRRRGPEHLDADPGGSADASSPSRPPRRSTRSACSLTSPSTFARGLSRPEISCMT